MPGIVSTRLHLVVEDCILFYLIILFTTMRVTLVFPKID